MYSQFGGVLVLSRENEKKESAPETRGKREDGGGRERQRGARSARCREEEEERVLCLRIPDYDYDDDDEMDEQIREEEMTVRKGAKRKRAHECDVCEKVFR